MDFLLQENKAEVLRWFAAPSRAVNGTADRTAASSGPPCPALWKKLCRTRGSYRAGSPSPSPSPVAPAAAAEPHIRCVKSMSVQQIWVLRIYLLGFVSNGRVFQLRGAFWRILTRGLSLLPNAFWKKTKPPVSCPAAVLWSQTHNVTFLCLIHRCSRTG